MFIEMVLVVVFLLIFLIFLVNYIDNKKNWEKISPEIIEEKVEGSDNNLTSSLIDRYITKKGDLCLFNNINRVIPKGNYLFNSKENALLVAKSILFNIYNIEYSKKNIIIYCQHCDNKIDGYKENTIDKVKIFITSLKVNNDGPIVDKGDIYKYKGYLISLNYFRVSREIPTHSKCKKCKMEYIEKEDFGLLFSLGIGKISYKALEVDNNYKHKRFVIKKVVCGRYLYDFSLPGEIWGFLGEYNNVPSVSDETNISYNFTAVGMLNKEKLDEVYNLQGCSYTVLSS